jgi:light-regulated signal transduction histidine kinase (bacteriophytochrome)
LERLNQDFEFQARVVCQDLQRPLQRILEYCQQLEAQHNGSPDAELQTWIDGARNAVSEVRRMTASLQSIADHHLSITSPKPVEEAPRFQGNHTGHS